MTLPQRYPMPELEIVPSDDSKKKEQAQEGVFWKETHGQSVEEILREALRKKRPLN